MTRPVKMRKGRDGYEASTEESMGKCEDGERIFKVHTWKANGGISSLASVCIRSGIGSGFISESFVMFQDYSKRFNATPCARVTEKAIVTAHQVALRSFDTLLIEARLHYATQVAA